MGRVIGKFIETLFMTTPPPGQGSSQGSSVYNPQYTQPNYDTQLRMAENETSSTETVASADSVELTKEEKVRRMRNKVLVSLLVVLFGTCSWIGVNSYWVELPLIVPVLPEGWNLPSYLSVIVQLGNVGPLFIALTKYFRPDLIEKHTPKFIFAVMLSGIVSMSLLANFWDKTTLIAGEAHSTALFILTFLVSLTNCTSNVVSLPFMSRFKPGFVSAYFVGMGVSGLIPAILALIQGAGAVQCVPANSTDNATGGTFEPVFLAPRFGVFVFFLTIFAVMLASLGAFILLSTMRMAREERSESGEAESLQPKENNVKSINYSNPRRPVNPSNRLLVMLMLGITVWICAIMDTLLPSIQSYTALPYGIGPYHFAVIAAGIANPIGCFMAFGYQPKKASVFLLLTLISTATSAYLVSLASLSPSPPLVASPGGAAPMVIAWAITYFLFAFIRTAIAEFLRGAGGETYLFYCGIATQLGSFLAAFIVFPLVNVLKLFKSAPYC